MPTYAFVDSIGASPTVVLNLDDQNPLSVLEGTRTAPPTRRVSSYGSSARDGDVVAQESYNDRSITIPLSFKEGTSAEVQATTIQALGRLLDGPQWLKWQHDGATAPVFLRTRYGDMDVDDEITSVTPTRYLTLTLVAEPFAYGLPESGSATVANDPTAGTNPMSYVFPTVKGDVATPLVLSVPSSNGSAAVISQPYYATVATTAVLSAPYYFDASAAAAPSNAGGWAVSNVTDSVWIGGSKRQAIKSTGVQSQLLIAKAATPVPSGDYRVFVRGAGNTPTVMTILANDLTLGSTKPVLAGTIPATGIGQTWWFDLGVMRLPDSSPPGGDPYGLVQPTASQKISVSISMAASAGTIEIDGLLFVPALLDSQASSKSLRTLNPTFYASAAADAGGSFIVDGVNQLAYGRTASGSPMGAFTVDGAGFPEVVPGRSNLLSLVRRTYGATATDGDTITTTAALSWSYYPRYLYVRPATT